MIEKRTIHILAKCDLWFFFVFWRYDNSIYYYRQRFVNSPSSQRDDGYGGGGGTYGGGGGGTYGGSRYNDGGRGGYGNSGGGGYEDRNWYYQPVDQYEDRNRYGTSGGDLREYGMDNRYTFTKYISLPERWCVVTRISFLQILWWSLLF